MWSSQAAHKQHAAAIELRPRPGLERLGGERIEPRHLANDFGRTVLLDRQPVFLVPIADHHHTSDAEPAATQHLDGAIEDALERYLDAQQKAVTALGPESTLEEVAAAFARPMISALTKGGRDRAAIRIVARAAIDPPEGWDRFDARFDQIRAEVVRVLKAKLSGVKTRELIFRIRCAAGMLNWLGLAPVGAELSDMSEKQAERMLVPIVAGAFRGMGSD